MELGISEKYRSVRSDVTLTLNQVEKLQGYLSIRLLKVETLTGATAATHLWQLFVKTYN